MVSLSQPASRTGLGIPGGLLLTVMIYRIVAGTECEILTSYLWTNHQW
jgi:hypothetical protein